MWHVLRGRQVTSRVPGPVPSWSNSCACGRRTRVFFLSGGSGGPFGQICRQSTARFARARVALQGAIAKPQVDAIVFSALTAVYLASVKSSGVLAAVLHQAPAGGRLPGANAHPGSSWRRLGVRSPLETARGKRPPAIGSTPAASNASAARPSGRPSFASFKCPQGGLGLRHFEPRGRDVYEG